MEYLRLEGISGHRLVQPACSEQGCLELASQNPVQMALEYFQGWRLHNLSGQPVSVLDHFHNKKNFSYIFSWLFNIILIHFTTKTILTKIRYCLPLKKIKIKNSMPMNYLVYHRTCNLVFTH